MMTRDPFDQLAIAADVYSWRRLFGEETLIRAKTIPLGEVPTRSQVPTETRTSRDEVAIASERSSARGLPQHCTSARDLTGTELDILEILDSANGVVSAQTLATELECSAASLKRGPLHRLLVDGRIEAVHGRGYRRAR